MDRNEILANFQACTSIDDIGECMTVLEEHNWDLENAVSATLAREHSVHPISNGSSQYQFNNHAFAEPVMQTYRCVLGELSEEVMLDDSSTVGNLKEVASIQLGIPISEMEFERWPPGSALSNPSDNTVLRTLHLPNYNVLTVKMQNPLPGVTVGLDETDQNPFDMPCPAWSAAGISSDVGDLMRKFSLKIMNKDTNESHLLSCEGAKTVQELRQDVIPMTGISYKNQKWSGFPGANPPDDDSTLASLNLDRPMHLLSVQSKVPVNSFANNHNIPFIYSAPPQSLTIERDSPSDDEYEDPLLDDDMMYPGVSSRPARAQLMPDQVDDVKGALSQFQVEFCTRYGIGPQFVADSLQNAMQKAFGTEARKRKLLAVYIHHDQSIQSNVFCSQLLCADSIVSFLNEQFVCWAWDITSDKNRSRLLQECNQLLGTGVSDTIRRMKKDEFPLLVLAQGKGRTCDITAIIKGNTELNELMAKLLKAVDDAEMQKTQDIREEDARNARERIKQEQEEAYQRSLEQDRAKIEKEAAEAKRVVEEERKRKEAEQRLQEEAARLLNLLPEEPDAKCGKPIIKVRFRAPNNETMTRNFLASDSLETLFNFVGSKGYSVSKYRVVKAFPKTNLMKLDRTTSLEDHKFHPQEALIIEEVDED